MVKNLSASAGDARDLGLIPGLGRSSGGGNGHLLQYSCLENSMDRGAWWAAVHGEARVGHNWVSERVHVHTCARTHTHTHTKWRKSENHSSRLIRIWDSNSSSKISLYILPYLYYSREQLLFKKYLYPLQNLSSQCGLLISDCFPKGSHPHEKRRVLNWGKEWVGKERGSVLIGKRVRFWERFAWMAFSS